MFTARIPGYNDILGIKQGYKGLYVRKTPVVDPVSKANTMLQETAWTPTPDELERLINGASVHVGILTAGHPPMKVEVGKEPRPEDTDLPAKESQL